MEYKWEYDNKEHEKELLKKVYAFGPLSFVFDVVWPVFWIAVSILFASFAYDEAKGYAAISLAFALVLPIYINSANSFADAVYFYRKTVHFPVFGITLYMEITIILPNLIENTFSRFSRSPKSKSLSAQVNA